ncbi:MAG: DUF2779 domain-containing protein [Gemmatimonadaceae bacterium]|nr:DUF2779 domain-containing protein [Gemmatimonadaceae bacterium]
MTPPPPHTLSKSDFKLARSCPTKLYYRELKYPDTRETNDYLQLLAEGGYMVELLAKQLFPGGITLDYTKGALGSAEETQQLLDQASEPRAEITLFEATLLHGARMARVDVLRRGPTGFDLYEVKSSSIDTEDALKRIEKTGSAFRSLRKPFDIANDWREYLEDVTYQVSILRDLYPDVPVRAHLILMNKQALAAHDEMPSWFRILRRDDGRLHTAEFIGDPALVAESNLTVSFDVSAEVAELEPEVREAAEAFVASITPELRKIPPEIGAKCRACEFRVDDDEPKNGFRECWGARADASPHILGLYQGRDLLVTMIERGVDRVTDIPDDVLAQRSGAYAERQVIQVEHSRSGKEFVDDSLRHDIAGARYPLHFIDFEAARIAVPHHKGMTPYGQLAFQWSCHTQRAPGAPLVHREYLNTDPRWPNESFARTLREAVGDDGTLLVWSAFERSVLRTVAEELSALGSGDPELAGWLRLAALDAAPDGGRQLDMLKLCRKKYFHPAMEGSNSIKAVLDALWKHVPDVRSRFLELTGVEGDPELGPYAALPPIEINGAAQRVAEGTGAINAYFAMVYGVERDDPVAKEQWSRLLLEYCKLDTLAMVLVWEHWGRVTGAGR